MSGDRKADYPCIACKAHVKKNDKAVQCSLCQLWVHVTCEGMADECFKVLANASKNGGMYWACRSCTAYAAKFNNSIQEINRRLSKLESKVEEGANEVKEVQEEVSAMKESIDKLNQNSSLAASNSSEAVFSELRERENRKQNLVIHNLEESGSRNKEDRIRDDKKLLHDVLRQMDVKANVDKEIKFITRIGRKPDEGSRPLLIGFKDQRLRDDVLDCSYRLNDCGEPWCDVNVIPDLTNRQRKEEREIRAEAKRLNDERSEDDKKNFQWKVVGRRGMSRLVKAAATREAAPGSGRNAAPAARSSQRQGRQGQRR